MARAQATTDHDVIRSWIESRKGHPSVVRATEGRKKGSAGLLRVDFNEPEDGLEEISWDNFFDTFDSNELAFLYQDTTAAGQKSRFHKFVNRDSVDEDAEGAEGGTRQAASAGKRGGASRQATPAEEEEVEEAEEEEVEEDEDADFDEDDDADDDEDAEEDDDEDEDEDEDFDEDDEDLDDDDDDDEDLDDDDDDEEAEEEEKPRRGGR